MCTGKFNKIYAKLVPFKQQNFDTRNEISKSMETYTSKNK
jgi:hypothetical protein